MNNSMDVVNNSTDAMSNQDTSESEQSSVGGSHKSIDDRRKPTCKLCANHNLKMLSNSHKRYCLGQRCLCAKCFQKRIEHKKTADKTKNTRDTKQDKERRELLEKKKLPKQELVDPSKPVIPFIISYEERYRDICRSNEGIIVFEKNIRNEVIINETKKQEVKKQRGKKRKINEEEIEDIKKRKINEEEIVESKGDILENLLRYTLYHSLVYNVYDMNHKNTIWALVNEIVASIHDYIYHSSNSNEDAGNSIYLLEAEKRIFSPSTSHHLKIIQQTIALNVILLFVTVYLTCYLFPP